MRITIGQINISLFDSGKIAAVRCSTPVILATAGIGLFAAGLISRFQTGNSTLSTTSTMTSKSGDKPKLIVFDLDYTLWPQHVDSTIDPPLRKDKHGHVFDSYGQAVKPFPEVPSLLEYLRSEGYQIAAASRTDAPPVANELIKLLDWDRYFDYREIYPGCKQKHFNRFQKSSGHSFNDMMFFDDEMRNIRDVSQLGVTAVYVRSEGMTRRLFDDGLAEWRKKNLKN